MIIAPAPQLGVRLLHQLRPPMRLALGVSAPFVLSQKLSSDTGFTVTEISSRWVCFVMDSDSLSKGACVAVFHTGLGHFHAVALEWRSVLVLH